MTNSAARKKRVASEQTWQVAEAKAKLSSLLAAAADAPQVIARRGEPIVVVVGIAAYRATAAKVEAASASAHMQRLLLASEGLRAAGGVTLPIGRRARRPSPFGR
ncbi:MAG: type II toxin-antitoxin system prevent-host-death family antitoxin [Polyangiales bacterium]